MKPLSQLRKELKEKEDRLHSDTLFFNALHKKAKLLKKKMVEDRKVIQALEKEIELRK